MFQEKNVRRSNQHVYYMCHRGMKIVTLSRILDKYHLLTYQTRRSLFSLPLFQNAQFVKFGHTSWPSTLFMYHFKLYVWTNKVNGCIYSVKNYYTDGLKNNIKDCVVTNSITRELESSFLDFNMEYFVVKTARWHCHMNKHTYLCFCFIRLLDFHCCFIS